MATNAKVPQSFKDLLISEEGSRPDVYRDSEGYLTAGVGHKLTEEDLRKYKEGDTVPQAVRDEWLEQDSEKAYTQARFQNSQLPNPMDVNRLASANFQLGTNWTSKFPETWEAMLDGDNEKAAMLVGQNADGSGPSQWSIQTNDRFKKFQQNLFDTARIQPEVLMADASTPTPAGTQQEQVENPILRAFTVDTATSQQQSSPPRQALAFTDPTENLSRAASLFGGTVSSTQMTDMPVPLRAGKSGMLADALQAGVSTVKADIQGFKGAFNLLTDDPEEAELALNLAKRHEEQTAELMRGFGEFGEFLDAPTFDGLVEQTIKMFGSFLPYMGATMVTGFTGMGVQALGKGVISASSKKVTKEMMERIVNKSLAAKKGGPPLSANEAAILDSAYKMANKVATRGKGRIPRRALAEAGVKAPTGAVAGYLRTRPFSYGFWAGAASQEYVSGTAQSLGEYSDAGYKLTKREAALANAMGIPQAFLGTISEKLFVGAMVKNVLGRNAKAQAKKRTAKTAAAKKAAQQEIDETTGWMRNVATSFGAGFAKGSAIEGATEGAQEGLFVAQRFAIDDEYTATEGKLRIAEGIFGGMVAGGPMRGTGEVVSRVIGKAREFVVDAPTIAEVYSKAKGREKDGTTEIEPPTWAVAQVKALVNPKNKRKAVFLPAGNLTLEEQRARVADIIIQAGKDANIIPFELDEGRQGIVLVDKRNKKYNAYVEQKLKEDGLTEQSIQEILGFTQPQNTTDQNVIVVRDQDGNAVDYQSTSDENIEQTTFNFEEKYPDYDVELNSKELFTEEKVEANLNPKPVKETTGLPKEKTDTDEPVRRGMTDTPFNDILAQQLSILKQTEENVDVNLGEEGEIDALDAKPGSEFVLEEARGEFKLDTKGQRKTYKQYDPDNPIKRNKNESDVQFKRRTEDAIESRAKDAEEVINYLVKEQESTDSNKTQLVEDVTKLVSKLPAGFLKDFVALKRNPQYLGDTDQAFFYAPVRNMDSDPNNPTYSLRIISPDIMGGMDTGGRIEVAINRADRAARQTKAKTPGWKLSRVKDINSSYENPTEVSAITKAKRGGGTRQVGQDGLYLQPLVQLGMDINKAESESTFGTFTREEQIAGGFSTIVSELAAQGYILSYNGKPLSKVYALRKDGKTTVFEAAFDKDIDEAAIYDMGQGKMFSLGMLGTKSKKAVAKDQRLTLSVQQKLQQIEYLQKRLDRFNEAKALNAKQQLEAKQNRVSFRERKKSDPQNEQEFVANKYGVNVSQVVPRRQGGRIVGYIAPTVTKVRVRLTERPIMTPEGVTYEIATDDTGKRIELREGGRPQPAPPTVEVETEKIGDTSLNKFKFRDAQVPEPQFKDEKGNPYGEIIVTKKLLDDSDKRVKRTQERILQRRRIKQDDVFGPTPSALRSRPLEQSTSLRELGYKVGDKINVHDRIRELKEDLYDLYGDDFGNLFEPGQQPVRAAYQVDEKGTIDSAAYLDAIETQGESKVDSAAELPAERGLQFDTKAKDIELGTPTNPRKDYEVDQLKYEKEKLAKKDEVRITGKGFDKRLQQQLKTFLKKVFKYKKSLTIMSHVEAEMFIRKARSGAETSLDLTVLDDMQQQVNAIKEFNGKDQIGKKNQKGAYLGYKDKDIIIVYMPDKPTKVQQLQALFSLGHEVGHAIYQQEKRNFLNKPGIRDRLYAEYEKAKAKPNAPSAYQDPKLGFEEWYSDQTSRWLLDTLSRETLIDGFAYSDGRKDKSGRFIPIFKPLDKFGTVEVDRSDAAKAKSIRASESLFKGKKPIKVQNIVDSYFKRTVAKIRDAWKELNKIFRSRFAVSVPFNEYMNQVREYYVDNDPNEATLSEQVIAREMSDRVIKNIEERAPNIKKRAAGFKAKVIEFLEQNRDLLPSDRKHWGVKYFLYPAHNFVSQYSPELANAMYSPSQSKVNTGYLNARILLIHKRMNDMLALLPKHKKGKFGRYSAGDPDFEASERFFLEAENDTKPTSELSPVAKSIRVYLQEFHKNNIEGVDPSIKALPRFFPRILAMHELQNSPELRKRLALLLAEKNPTVKADWDKIVEAVTNKHEHNIDDVIDADIESDKDVTSAITIGMAKSRAKYFKKISNTELRNIGVLEDAGTSLRKYIEDMTKRLEYLNKVQTVVTNADLELLNERRVSNDISETMYRTLAKEGETLRGWKASELMLQRIEDRSDREVTRSALQAMLGKTGLNMSPLMRNINSALLTLNVVTYLTFATLASLPDLAGPVLRSKDLDGFKEALKQVRNYFDNKQDANDFAREVGTVTFDSINTMYINATQLGFLVPKAQKITDMFFRVTMLENFTRFSRVYATGMGKAFLTNTANKLSDPNLSAAERKRYSRYLEELQVSVEDINAAKQKGSTQFVFEGESGERVRAALGRFVDESIVRPNSAERPAWASNPYTALIWQLKSFFYAYGKNIIGGALRETKNRYAEDGTISGASLPLVMGALTILPLTMIGLETREWAKYFARGGDRSAFRTDSMSWGEYMFEILDRAGPLGPFGIAIPMYEASDYGGSWWVPFFGPTVGRVEDIARGKAEVSDFTPAAIL